MADNDWEKQIDWKEVKIYHAKRISASGKFLKWNKKNYRHIADTKVIVPTSHEMCCEMAYDVTQNFDDYWCEKVKSLDWVAEGLHRSTTFGDVVAVNDVPYRCETTGWTKIN